MQKRQTSKSTIKNDPFASVIPMPIENEPQELNPPEAVPSEEEVAKPTRKPRAVNADRTDHTSSMPVPTKLGKQKLTVHLDAALADRVKNAAYWNPRLTIAAIAEYGIRHAIEKIERENGGKYQPREGELLGGRPIK